MKKFSIIICGYNESKHLDSVIKACLEQEYDKDSYEVIYVDNNSTDGSFELAQQYQITTLLETKQGPSEARNRGIAAATGEILLFLDSDAYPHPTYLKECEVVFNDEEIGAAAGKVLPLKETWVSNYLGVSLLEGYPRFSKKKYMNACPSCNLAIRKSVLNKVGVFLERLSSGSGVTRFSEDKELCGRIRAGGYKIQYNPRMSVRHENAYTFKRLFSVWVKGSLARVGMMRMGKKDGLTMLFKYNIPLVFLLALIVSYLYVPALAIILFLGWFIAAILLSYKSYSETKLLFQSVFIKPWMDPLSAVVINTAVLYNRTR